MMTLSIQCDGGCMTFLETPTQHDNSATDIDRELDPGWVHIGDQDFCPRCAKQRSR